MRSRRRSILLILATVAVLFVASSTIAMAKTNVYKTIYQGNGKVAVYFQEAVKFDNPSVIVKDSDKKTYKDEILATTTRKIQFQIKDYKTDETYKITIKGADSGNEEISLKILSKDSAKKIAKDESNAKSIHDVECESGTHHYYAIWRVTFKGISSDKEWEYTYLIRQQDGRVLASSKKQA